MDKEKRDIRVVFIVFAGLFCVVAGKKFPSTTSYVLIGLSLALLFFLIVSPLTLRPVFSVWMKLAHFVGRINTQILLFVIFVFFFVPLGMLMRLFGYDPMQRKREKHQEESYWQTYDHAGIKEKGRYERQF